MTRVHLKIEGGDQLIAALRKLGKEGEAEIAKVVTMTAIDVHGDIIKRYQKGPKTGKTYTRGNITHTASAAGEAPATDTGRLVSGTDLKSTGKLSAEVGNNVKYGPMLEFGTMKIAPRPAWVPAVEAAAPKYLTRMETALARLIKK